MSAVIASGLVSSQAVPATFALLRAGGGAFGTASPSISKSPPKAPASVYKTWFQVSEPIRFFVSGNIGNVCFFFLERLIYYQLGKMNNLPQSVVDYKESVSFFIGYLLQIVSQHLLNAVLVYGLDTIDTRAKYFKTLVGQSSAYIFALFGSTFLNLGLLQAGLEKSTAFVSTLMIFACINYFVIGWIVRAAAGVEISEYPPVNTRTGAAANTKKKPSRVLHRGGENAVFECDTSTQIQPQQMIELTDHVDIPSINEQVVVDLNHHDIKED
jgi:hypothetical protein